MKLWLGPSVVRVRDRQNRLGLGVRVRVMVRVRVRVRFGVRGLRLLRLRGFVCGLPKASKINPAQMASMAS